MAQVKMQTTANLSGPTMAPVVLPLPVTATNTLSLPSSINGSISESAASCSSPTASLVDSASLINSPAPLQDNMANPKEKTPMCLVNELARFNRIQPQYKLLNERGPAHAKMFTVQLTLGEQTWEAEGSSIKKAQHAAASKALNETTLPKPTPRPPKNNVNNNPGSITPTVELNGLAMKRGEPAIYRPLDPKPIPNYRANYNFRGMYNQRYHCPVPKIFYVQLTVGNSEFFGEGKTRQAARHNAAMKALQALQNEPIPEKLPQNGESGKDSEEDKDANKSEISVVFEIALKRNIPVTFEVIKESGPPHMKSFVTRVTVGEFTAEGEGNSKKLSKKRAAMAVLQELKKLPPLPVIEKPKLYFKKRPKTILKTGPEYGQGMNPISRLAQIQQAKKEKEPEYVLLSERGMPRRREFVMQVKVGNDITTGTGPNKKIAKRNAAEAMLLQLGYKASTPLQDQTEKLGENKSWNGQNVGFPLKQSSVSTQSPHHGVTKKWERTQRLVLRMELNLPRLYQAIPSEAGGIVTHLKATANPTSSGKTKESTAAPPLGQSLSLQKLGRKKLGHSAVSQLIQLNQRGVRESGTWTHVPSWSLSCNPWVLHSLLTAGAAGQGSLKQGLGSFLRWSVLLDHKRQTLSYTLEKQPG